jgi:hypothetical protein
VVLPNRSLNRQDPLNPKAWRRCRRQAIWPRLLHSRKQLRQRRARRNRKAQRCRKAPRSPKPQCRRSQRRNRKALRNRRAPVPSRQVLLLNRSKALRNRRALPRNPVPFRNRRALRPRRWQTAVRPNAATVTKTTVLVQIHIARMPDVPSFDIHFTRSESCGLASTANVTRTLTFGVGTAGYHFEAGLLFPIVFQGLRTVSAIPFPNTNDSTIQTSTSLQAVPVAIALHYFPWGILGGKQASTWTIDLECKGKLSCLIRYPYYWFVTPLGLEAGATIGTNPFQEYFLGVAYGPVRGGTISAGMAFVQGQYIPKSYQEGMLIPTNGNHFTPDTKYMIRPYIGLTLSPEIIGTVLSVLGAAKKIAPTKP